MTDEATKHEAEMQPWPKWADDIRKKLIEYGYDGGPEDEWNIGEMLGDWLDGAVHATTEKLNKENASLRSKLSEAETVIAPFARLGKVWPADVALDLAIQSPWAASCPADLSSDDLRRAAAFKAEG